MILRTERVGDRHTETLYSNISYLHCSLGWLIGNFNSINYVSFLSMLYNTDSPITILTKDYKSTG